MANDEVHVFSVDGGEADGLTSLERMAKESPEELMKRRVDPALLHESVRRQIQEAANQQTAEYEKRALETTPDIPETQDISSLPSGQQKEYLEKLQAILEAAKKVKEGQSDNKPEPSQQSVPEFVVPGFDEEPEKPKEAKNKEFVKAEPEPSDDHLCPNCNWPTDVDPIHMDTRIKTAWFAATLGGKRFTNSYNLFGDQVTLAFRTRTMQEQNAISAQLVKEIRNGDLPASPNNFSTGLYLTRMRKLQMACSFHTITGMDNPAPEVDLTNENAIAEQHDRIFGNWSEQMYSAAYKEYCRFDELCVRLTEAMNSPDFWKGANGST